MNRSTTSIPAWGRAVDRTVKLLPHAARSHNRALVLQTLMSREIASRADIARETALTRVTVSDLIAELIDGGLVEEVGISSAGKPGKPATMLKVNPEARHIVGIDLSNVGELRAAVFDLVGEILWEHTEFVPETTGEAVAQAVARLAARALIHVHRPLLGVGVASPGVIDAEGTVVTAPNFQWENYPLAAILTEQLGAQVHVANDANAAVMAASSIWTEQEDLLLVTIGFGVGAGLILDGDPRLGSRYAAGEIGHVVVGTDVGPRCVCGKEGCLEAWLSEPSLRAVLAKAGSQEQRTQALAEAGRRLGIALAPIVGALNVTDVILSGPHDLLDGPLRAATEATVRERLLDMIVDTFTVHLMPDAQDAAIRGAAAIVIAAELGVS